MTGLPKLSELPAHSIQIATQSQVVRINDENEETEQCYLTFRGSPEGFRWLSEHFGSLAKSAEKHGNAGNIVAAWDFKNDPIKLDDWDSLDFLCKKQSLK